MKSDVDFKSFDEAYISLTKDKDLCAESLMRMTAGVNKGLYPLDFLMVAALNRASSQLSAVIELLRTRNFVVAASLLRLQLDSCLRIHGAWLVSDPHDYAQKILKGVKISKLKSSSGEAMQDIHLRNSLSKEFPWVNSVYENTSGFIHLSEKHISCSLRDFQASSLKVTMVVSDRQEHIPDEKFLELASAFSHVTRVLLWFVSGWSETKRLKAIEKK
jgi:hypothetical protein